MHEFASKHAFLVLGSAVQARPGFNSTEGQHKSHQQNYESYIGMEVVFDCPIHFYKSTYSIDERSRQDNCSTNCMQHLIVLPVMLHVPSQCDLKQTKEGPGCPHHETVDQEKTDPLFLSCHP